MLLSIINYLPNGLLYRLVYAAKSGIYEKRHVVCQNQVAYANPLKKYFMVNLPQQFLFPPPSIRTVHTPTGQSGGR